MRDIKAIDDDLRLRATVRLSLREHDRTTATGVEIDEQIDRLLDERLEMQPH
jgi:hypothetical protein